MGFKLNAFLTGALDERSNKLQNANAAMLAREDKMRDFIYRMAPLVAAKEDEHEKYNARLTEGRNLSGNNETLAQMYANNPDMDSIKFAKTVADFRFQKAAQQQATVGQQTDAALSASKPPSPFDATDANAGQPLPPVPTVQVPSSTPSPTDSTPSPTQAPLNSGMLKSPPVTPVVRRGLLDTLLGNTSNKQIDDAIFSSFGQEFGTDAAGAQKKINGLINGDYVHNPYAGKDAKGNPFTAPAEDVAALAPRMDMKELLAMSKSVEWKDAKDQKQFFDNIGQADTDPAAYHQVMDALSRQLTEKEKLELQNEKGGSDGMSGFITQAGLPNALNSRMRLDYVAKFTDPDPRTGIVDFRGGSNEDPMNLLISNIQRRASKILADTGDKKWSSQQVQTALDQAQSEIDPETYKKHAMPAASPTDHSGNKPNDELANKAVRLDTLLRRKLAGTATPDELVEAATLNTTPGVADEARRRFQKK